MTPIDFKALFDERGVEYSTRQHSVGNIGVNCPFCAREGDPDPSHHLGINLENGKWSCWRHPTAHKGVKPHRLLHALLGMSYTDIDALVGVRSDVGGEFDSVFAAGADPFAERSPEENRADNLSEADKFVELTSGLALQHRLYLFDRGIKHDFAAACGVKAGVVGRWLGRVIFPLIADGQLISWVARKIVRQGSPAFQGPKYLTAKGKPIKNYLWQYDRVTAASSKNLVVTEGVFDALQLQQYAHSSVVTCLFGRDASEEQIAILHDAKTRFDRLIIMLDDDAGIHAEQIAHQVGAEVIHPRKVFGVSDPGGLRPEHATTIQNQML